MSFCKNCGYLYGSEQDNICGNCGVPRGIGNKFCSNCGSSLSEGQVFCSMCGYRNQESSESNFRPISQAQPVNMEATANTNTFNNASYSGNFNNTTTFAENNTASLNQNSVFNNTAPTAPGYVATNAYSGQAMPVQQGSNTAPKSKVVAGILGIFFGAFGVHNFYLGYTKKAITQLSLTIVGIFLSCVVVGVFLIMGISIWALVESILILAGNNVTDADGNLLE